MQSVQRSIQLEADTAPQRDNEPQTTTTIDNAPTRTLRDREQELRAQLLARSRVPPRREGSNKRPQPESTDDTEAPTAPSVASGEINTTREEDGQMELYGEPEDWTVEAEQALALVQQESGGTHKKGRRRSKGSKRRHDYGHTAAGTKGKMTSKEAAINGNQEGLI